MSTYSVPLKFLFRESFPSKKEKGNTKNGNFVSIRTFRIASFNIQYSFTTTFHSHLKEEKFKSIHSRLMLDVFSNISHTKSNKFSLPQRY